MTPLQKRGGMSDEVRVILPIQLLDLNIDEMIRCLHCKIIVTCNAVSTILGHFFFHFFFYGTGRPTKHLLNAESR